MNIERYIIKYIIYVCLHTFSDINERNVES